jgi:hypothetical protein
VKIYSSRRDDLIAERDAYDAETAKYENLVDEGEQNWHQAGKAVEDSIANQVLNIISPTSLEIEVYPRSSWSDKGYEVNIRANEHEKFNDNRALSWSMDIKLDSEGNVVKESSAWSGLSATTPEQLDDLKESVRVIELLNNVDWKPILNVATPKYSDYVDSDAREELQNRKANRPDYKAMLLVEDINDAIESGQWIEMKGRPETAYMRGSKSGDFYGRVLKQSDKFVTVVIVNSNTIKGAQEGNEWAKGRFDDSNAERIGKDNFMRYVKDPFTTIDINF